MDFQFSGRNLVGAHKKLAEECAETDNLQMETQDVEADHQKIQIAGAGGLDEAEPQEHDLWAVVSWRFLQEWKEYVGWGGSDTPTQRDVKPGSIDNSTLQDDTGKIIGQEGADYTYIPLDSMKLLLSWYGGGPLIPRYTYLRENGRGAVELNPYVIEVAEHKQDEVHHEFRTILASRFMTGKELKDLVSEFYADNYDETRLWFAFCSSPNRPVEEEELEKPLSEILTSRTDNQFLLEKKEIMDDSFPLDYDHFPSTSSSSRSSSSFSLTSNRFSSYGFGSSSRRSYYENSGNNLKADPGLCGLSNLGNTCFMNSALQCLTKTPQFLNYFTNGLFSKEINVHNPIGLKGELAESFASVMKLMWSGQHSRVTPSKFKSMIARIAPQFTGFQQHDSNELIGYLLNGLHEDLNRVIKKPGTISVEAGDEPDEKIADLSWKVMTLRDDSIINDLFTGQYKGTVVCPKCGYQSTTFDTFKYVQLPLPDEGKKPLEVIYVSSQNQAPPCKMLLQMPRGSVVGNIRSEVAKLAQVPPETLVVMDIFNNRVYNQYHDMAKCSTIRANDVTVVYCVPELSDGTVHQKSNISERPVGEVMISIQKRVETYSYGSSKRRTNVGNPIILNFENGKTTGKQLYNSVHNFMKSYWSQLSPKDQEQISQLVMFPGTESSDGDLAMANGSDSLYQLKLTSSDESIVYDDTPISTRGSSHYSSSSSSKPTYQFTLQVNVNEVDLDSDMFKETVDHPSKTKIINSQKKGIDLDSCFNLFAKKEQLSKENTWYCPKCKEHVQGMKKMDIYKSPEILVIQLNRFQYDENTRRKINCTVDYPLTLDMTKHVLDKNNPHKKYDLFAVSNHFGGLGGGHYIAHAKVGGQWYQFDDDRVSPANERSIVDDSGYVLFYCSQNMSQPSVQPQVDGVERSKDLGLEKYCS